MTLHLRWLPEGIDSEELIVAELGHGSPSSIILSSSGDDAARQHEESGKFVSIARAVSLCFFWHAWLFVLSLVPSVTTVVVSAHLLSGRI